ncbi:MAG: hypothetical protein U0746_12770 [Gemmataceae bacterium]
MKQFIVSVVVITFLLAVFGPILRGFHNEGTQPVTTVKPPTVTFSD